MQIKNIKITFSQFIEREKEEKEDVEFKNLRRKRVEEFNNKYNK